MSVLMASMDILTGLAEGPLGSGDAMQFSKIKVGGSCSVEAFCSV